jgi:hypothetical protein
MHGVHACSAMRVACGAASMHGTPVARAHAHARAYARAAAEPPAPASAVHARRFEGLSRDAVPHGMGVMIFGNGTGGGFHFRDVRRGDK